MPGTFHIDKLNISATYSENGTDFSKLIARVFKKNYPKVDEYHWMRIHTSVVSLARGIFL
jgi:hypothetical protein